MNKVAANKVEWMDGWMDGWRIKPVTQKQTDENGSMTRGSVVTVEIVFAFILDTFTLINCTFSILITTFFQRQLYFQNLKSQKFDILLYELD